MVLGLESQEDVRASENGRSHSDDSEVHSVEPEVETPGGDDPVRFENHHEASENDSKDMAPEDGDAAGSGASEQEDAPEHASEKQTVPEDVGDEVLEAEAREQLAERVVVSENAPEEGSDAKSQEYQLGTFSSCFPTGRFAK